MQAVQAGLVGLDEPVRSQLQEFSVADPGATIEITPRHLLTHTSGIEGDHLIDTGWNPDALARYVATLAGLGQLHPDDEAYSFCNTGYGVLGRLLEVATGDDFDKVLRRRLTRPLGCRTTVTLPTACSTAWRSATRRPSRSPAPRARWALTRSRGPMGRHGAGRRASPSPLHIDEGRTAGRSTSGAASGRRMQRRLRRRRCREAQALGWTVRPWGDLRAWGSTPTRSASGPCSGSCRRGVAACVMANSPLGGSVAQSVLGHPGRRPARRDRARPRRPRGTATADVTPAHLAGVTGTYDRLHQRVAVSVDGQRLLAATEPSGVLRALGVKGSVLDAVPTGLSEDGAGALATDPATGQLGRRDHPGHGVPARGLYLGGRLHQRVT